MSLTAGLIAAEAMVLVVAGATLTVMSVRALVVHQHCRPPTAVALGVAGLFAFLWGLPTIVPAAAFGLPVAVYEVMFFGIVGVAVFLYTAELGRFQAQRLERSLAGERAKAQSLVEKDHQINTVLGSASVALVALDGHGHVLLAEGQALEEMGLPDLVGLDAAHIVRSHRKARRLMEQALRGKEVSDVVGVKGRAFEVSLLPLRGTDGEVDRIMGFAVDATSRLLSEKEQRRSLRQRLEIRRLREVDEFKTRLLNTASHELNTPLTPLVLQLRVLRNSLPGSDVRQRRAMQVLDRNVRRLADLVKDVLDVARLQNQSLLLNVAPHRMSRIVAEVSDTYLPQTEEQDIRLKVAVDPDLDVLADADRTHQVLANLVSNALRFTPPGGQVVVRAQRQGERALIEVIDTGIGLAPEQITRLFQPFSQVHDPLAHDVGGTGLGLYICKGIVEQSGGTMGVDSEGPGQGSVFWFTLPLAPLRMSPGPQQA